MFDRLDMMNGLGGAGGFWMLAGILVIAGAIVVSTWIIVRSQRPVPATGATALEMLRQRYARGEITRDEFETTRRTLDS
jgi:putative membrane protein